MRPIVEFEIIDHGVEHEQYFQGCGLAFTSFKDVSTGCGYGCAEAIDDALEQLAMNDWETEGMEQRIKDDCGLPPDGPAIVGSGEDQHYYVSIRVK